MSKREDFDGLKPAMDDLTRSWAWEVLKGELLKRRQGAINCLLTAKEYDKLKYAQLQVQEIDFLLKLPHQLTVQEEKNG